jgi:uncharacterized membrane protein YeaQ/YmgE (transglycosylase-associated protein family)
VSGETILIAISVGLFSGWLVHLVGRGSGFPLTGSLAIASLGAILGELLLPYAGLNSGRGGLAVAINAGLGGALVLLVFKFLRPKDDRTPVKQDGGKL